MSIYDSTLSLDRDKVRFLVGDTDDDNQMLSDSEIAFALSENNDGIYLASADLCEALAAGFARDVNYRFSTLWLNAGDAYKHFVDRGIQLRSDAESATGQPIFTMGEGTDPDAPEIFWYGMHDNPPIPQVDES